jgi:CDP-diacylglycerol--glycerol-3-phosphate 3-phosphatidyltransferase
MLSSKARALSDRMIRPVGQGLASVGVTANSLTMLGLGGNVGAAALISVGLHRLGGAAVLVSALFDTLDGAVAKASGRVSRWGAFLDSLVDRLSEMAVLIGLILFATQGGTPTIALLAAVVLGLSITVSYVKACAESLGYKCNTGIAERAERIIVLSVALMLGHVLLGLWVLTAATTVTIVQRVAQVWRQPETDGKQPPSN